MRRLSLALTAALSLWAASVRAEPLCPPSVKVDAEPELREPIHAALRQRGLLREPAESEGCLTTRVLLSRRDGQITVELSDEVRGARRTVADPETAVAVIESWVRSDLSAPLLLALMPPRDGESVVRMPTATPAPSLVGGARVMVEGALELGGDSTSALWVGGSLRACGRVSILCLGGVLRAMGDVDRPPALPRHAVTQLMFLAALPVRYRWFGITPSLGLGIAWVRHDATITTELPVDNSGSSSSGSDDGLVPGPAMPVRSDLAGLHSEARLAFFFYLPRGIAITASAAMTAALTGRGGPSVVVPTAESSQAALLPNLPWGVFLGQLGLSWSRP